MTKFLAEKLKILLKDKGQADFLKNSGFLEQSVLAIDSFQNFTFLSHCFIYFLKIKTVAVETQEAQQS